MGVCLCARETDLHPQLALHHAIKQIDDVELVLNLRPVQGLGVGLETFGVGFNSYCTCVRCKIQGFGTARGVCRV